MHVKFAEQNDPRAAGARADRGQRARRDASARSPARCSSTTSRCRPSRIRATTTLDGGDRRAVAQAGGRLRRTMTSANVKVCVACHGLEVGMAYVDLRAADELNVRVGRFTPAFGSFPLRHDPANHRTSDKPLPYDMGRMLALQRLERGRAAGAVGRQRHRGRRHALLRRRPARLRGVRGRRPEGRRPIATDFDFIAVALAGEQLLRRQQLRADRRRAMSGTLEADDHTLTLGASGMAGPLRSDRKLGVLDRRRRSRAADRWRRTCAPNI